MLVLDEWRLGEHRFCPDVDDARFLRLPARPIGRVLMNAEISCQQGSRQIHVVLASTGCLVIHAWSVWWFFKHLLTKALMFECIFSHLGVHLSIAGDIYADRSLLPFLYHSSYIDPLNS